MRYLLLLALVWGCGGDDDAAVDAGVDAGSDAGGMDVGTDAALTDAGIDSGVDAGTDTSRGDAGCVGQRDEALCVAAGATCGMITATDRCGVARTPNCGTCIAPEACGVEEPNQCANAAWMVTRIDAGGAHVDLAIDEGDRLHVAFRKDDELWYGALIDGSWTTERVADPILGGDVAIAIDGSGVVHVASTAGSTSPSRAIDLWTLTGGAWSQTLIDGLSVTSIDLVFEGDAAQLCGYHPPMGGFGGILTHFAEDASGFMTTIIDGVLGSSASREGNYCSLGFDGTNLHVGYHGGQFQRLEYAEESGGSWTVETVDEPSGDFAGEYVSLALDGASPVLSYRALVIGDPEIRLARRNGAGWDIATVDDGAGVIANHTSLALDGAGRAHISYFDSDAPGTIRYARETATGFERSDVAVVGTGTGGYNAIGIDSTGRVHIVFFDSARDELVHATPR